jgi:hypothetical protein
MERTMTVALAIGRNRRAEYLMYKEVAPATPLKISNHLLSFGPNGFTPAVITMGIVNSRIPKNRKQASCPGSTSSKCLTMAAVKQKNILDRAEQRIPWKDLKREGDGLIEE